MKAGDPFDLSNEVILVTGASSGLGRRFAEVLAANGAKVALAARRIERLEALAGEIRGRGGAAMPIALDVADRGAIPHAFDAVEHEFGPISVLVNNAGIARDGSALKASREDWRAVLDTNLDAVFDLAQEAARRMAARGAGNIVNIASVFGVRPAKGVAAYAVSKAGVVQLTRVMALELANRGVRVNALAPGYVLTEINRDFFETPDAEKVIKAIPMGRVGQVEDLDGAILFLASPASRFMTGAVLLVDGGHAMTI